MDINEQPTRLARLLQWREDHLSERTFVLMLAVLVGFFCAVVSSMR